MEVFLATVEEAEVVSVEDDLRCSRQLVLNVEILVRFHSDRLESDQYTAVTVSEAWILDEISNVTTSVHEIDEIEIIDVQNLLNDVCSRQLVRIVENLVRFHSNQQLNDQYIVAIVS